MKTETITNNTGRDFIIASILFIVSLGLRLYAYKGLPIYNDELFYSNFGYNTLANNLVWQPEDMVEPPFLMSLVVIVTYFYRGGFDVLRLIPIIFASLNVVFIYFLGKILYSRKVGLLSAILLSFSSFHILYSRLLMLEAVVVSLMSASLYFFWKSYSTNDIRSAWISGLFMGLAINTKWIALLLYPALVLFLFWTTKKLRSLLDKRILIIFSVSFLMLLPTLFLFHSSGRDLQDIFFEKEVSFAHDISTVSYGSSLVSKSINKYVEVLIDGTSLATLSLPWYDLYQFSASFLLLVTLFYYLYFFLKVQLPESFLMSVYFVVNFFIFFYIRKSPYYLLWALPIFLIMIANLIVTFMDHLKSRFIYTKLKLSLADLGRVSTLIVFVLFIVSYTIVGIEAPILNKGDKSGYDVQIRSIKHKTIPGDIILTDRMKIIEYYISRRDFNENGNILTLPAYILEKTGKISAPSLNLELLDRKRSRFIIVKKYRFDVIVNSQDRMKLNENYNFISNENDVLLYERKEFT
ncbi:MAG: glycosyltransferase family 39 protein [Candidatus Hodarchaeales archaeon]|jgi:4-amino-4-deoxy-L-arabinose transferase-like glycosyltransferase